MKIASWNINGIKARLDNLLTWLGESGPDVVCLQETKTVDEAFPSESFETLGYNVVFHGQKSFNGVAILSKHPIEEATVGLPGDESDEHARFIEVVLATGTHPLHVVGAYMPNGNPVESDKFGYKLNWMKRLEVWLDGRLALEEPMIVAGDYNIIPQPPDCHDPAIWEGDALYRPESRAAWRRLEGRGLYDAVRATTASGGIYTFWDYQGGAWPKDNGIRIDHMLLSPEAADKLKASGIDRHVRAWEKPSDHVPVWVELAS